MGLQKEGRVAELFGQREQLLGHRPRLGSSERTLW